MEEGIGGGRVSVESIGEGYGEGRVWAEGFVIVDGIDGQDVGGVGY